MILEGQSKVGYLVAAVFLCIIFFFAIKSLMYQRLEITNKVANINTFEVVAIKLCPYSGRKVIDRCIEIISSDIKKILDAIKQSKFQLMPSKVALKNDLILRIEETNSVICFNYLLPEGSVSYTHLTLPTTPYV